MSDEIEDDLHDQLLKAFFEYCRFNERFEIYGYKESSQSARSSLNEIMKLAKKRKVELYQRQTSLHGPRKYYGKQAEQMKTKTNSGKDDQ